MITRRLVCKLEDSEILLRGQQLAETHHERADIEGERKATADEFKRTLQAIDTRIHDLSAAIKYREEIRDVECIVQDDHIQMKHDVIRLDTGEVVESRPFTESERQKSLFDPSIFPESK